MKTFARIQDGRVAELFNTGADIRHLFHPSLVWIDVTATKPIAIGWLFNGTVFSAPPPIPSPAAPEVTIADLQRQVALLAGQIEALRGH